MPGRGKREVRRLYPVPLGLCEECREREATQRHHRDRNPTNNTRENVQLLCPACHTKEHSEEIRQGMAHPEVRAQMSRSLRATYADPEVRARVGDSVRRAMKNPETRRAISEAQKMVWTPERRAIQAEIMRERRAQQRAAREATQPDARLLR